MPAILAAATVVALQQQDAKALQEKTAKKAAQAAGGNNAGEHAHAYSKTAEAKLHDESRLIQRCFDDNKDDNKR
ncbi:hypothetical protein JHK87_044742 [Glycine soja]|nr:hypothetical protein JHK87_044742 [Glycine soja]